jgi:Family of unknown function (DUF6476)
MTDMSDIPDPKNTDSYRMLRAVVIGLGVLIVIAVVLLVVGLATRLGGHTASGSAQSSSAYTLPGDAKIVETQVSGNRLILTAREMDGDHVFVFSTDDGKLVGEIAPGPK